MSSLKNTVDKIKNLEAEKTTLLAELEELKKIAQAKSDTLASEINALREEINSLKDIVGTKQPPAPKEPNLENSLLCIKGVMEKTQSESRQLGSVIFPNSPYSQHFDNWLARLQKIILDFESNPQIKMDEQFIKERSQILLEIEGSLTKIKAEELNANILAKSLSDNNHLLIEADKEYSEKTKELSTKKETEIQRLTNQINTLDNELKVQEKENSRKILKKKTDDKIPQLIQDLNLARSKLETAKRDFADQQEKLDIAYEQRKQDIMIQTESYRKKLEQLETDMSAEPRRVACQTFSDSINALAERTGCS